MVNLNLLLHGLTGCDSKNVFDSAAVPPVPVWIPISLPRVSRLSAYYESNNMKLGLCTYVLVFILRLGKINL
jgi:hypothetical protein